MNDVGNTKITRREFSRRTAVGATALAGFSIAKTAHSNDDELKIAVIGSGGRGTGAVRDAMQASPNVKLLAVHDALENRAKGCVRSLRGNENLRPNILLEEDDVYTGVDGYKQLLEDHKSELDYVILAAPPGARPSQFEAVVDAGLNCFCEKPVATDPAGIRRFMAAAKKSEELKLHVTAGTQRRHQRNYVETVDKLHNGILGEILVGRAYWCRGLPFAHDRPAGMSDLQYQLWNWYNFCWICGDNIVEQHIHNLDVMNWVLQANPVSVIASGGRSWKPAIEKYGNIWDNFSCDYEYPNGVRVYSFSRHLNHSYSEVSELVVGTNTGYRNGRSNCADMGESGPNPYVQEHTALQESIRGTGPYWNEAVQVCEATLTAIMGRIAAYTGQRVTWDEAYNMDLDITPKNLSFDAEVPVDPIPQTPMP